MIYTLTLNPALDYHMEVPDFVEGMVNRSVKEELVAGGKGINVSRTLSRLGVDSVILGFAGGATGEHLCQLLAEEGLNEELIRLKSGMTRINVKLRGIRETEVNAMGPKIAQAAQERLLSQMDTLESGDVLVLSGVPGRVGAAFMTNVLEMARERAVRLVIDMSGDSLRNALAYRPFLVKPNRRELEELFGERTSSLADLHRMARKMQEFGAQNVLVSLGEEGAYLLTDTEAYFERAPLGKVVCTVGAGDSLIAGYLFGLCNQWADSQILRFAVFCGSASAFAEEGVTREEVERLMEGAGNEHF